MLQRLSNSWELAKASARVLRADKELLVFPVLSAVAAAAVTVSFLVPAYAAGLLEGVAGEGEGRSLVGYVVLFLFYLAQYLVIFTFNTALVGAALIRLGGGDPTARDGLRIAGSHFRNILGYAAMAATVGVIISLLVDRGGRSAQAIGRIGGLGWSLATFLVVPVLVAEGLGPLGAVRRSAELLRRTWGEQIAGSVGIGAVFFLAFLATIVVGVVAVVAAASTGSAWVVAPVAVAFALVLVAIGLVQGALSGIYTAAVYRYAMGEDVSAFFPREVVASAIRRG